MGKKETTAAPAIQGAPPTNLVELAIHKGADPDKLDKLLALQERWEASQAKKLFFEALALFQQQCPEIVKDDKADFKTSKGRTTYNYATLPGITRQIKPALEGVGLSYRWEFDDVDGKLQATCILTHTGGHSERTTMKGDADTSGSKNPIQSRGSTMTYLQRYTLIGALGLSTAQDDVDGNQERPPEPHLDKMTQEQAKKITSLLEELGDEKEAAQITGAMKAFTMERAEDAIAYLTGRSLDLQADKEGSA